MQGAVSQLLFFSNWSQWADILDMDGNVYFKEAGIFARGAGEEYPTFRSWQARSHKDAGSLFADPLFEREVEPGFSRIRCPVLIQFVQLRPGAIGNCQTGIKETQIVSQQETEDVTLVLGDVGENGCAFGEKRLAL